MKKTTLLLPSYLQSLNGGRIICLCIAALAIISLTGCMSDAQSQQVADSYQAFISQDRYMPLQTFDFGTNGNGTVTYTGLVSMRTYAPLDKLSGVPENPGTAREIVDGVVRVGAIGAAAYGVHELSNSGGSTTINNTTTAP